MGQSYSHVYDWKPELPDFRGTVYKYPKVSVKLSDQLDLRQSFKDYTTNFGSSPATSIASVLDSYGLKYVFDSNCNLSSIGECMKSFKIIDENLVNQPAENKPINYTKLSNFKNQLKQSLHEGYPIIFGFTVYESFEDENVKETGIVKMPSKDEKILGGLSAIIVGYNKNQDYWIVKHTLGKEFGDDGYIYIDSDILENSSTDDYWFIKKN